MVQDAHERLKIELTARRDYVPVESFLKVVSAVLEILKDIDAQMSDSHRRGARWKVAAASLQSPLTLAIAGQDRQQHRVAEISRAYMNGIDSIERGADVRPLYFSDRSLLKAKQMVSVLNDGVSRLQVSALGQTVTPTQKLAAHVDALNETAFSAYGSFEGTLETLSIHNSTQFVLYDRLTGDPVQCFFDAEHLDDAKAAFARRVRVYGMVRYRADGRPKCITIDGPIERLRHRGQLPQASDVEGVNITGGIDSVEYVRMLRDAE